MGAIYTIWLREMKLFVRVKTRVIGSLAAPFFWLAFVGIGLSSSFRFSNLPASYLDFLTPGIIGMTLLFSSMNSGISVLWDKQFGFMKEMLIAPVSRISIALGKTAGGVTIALFQGYAVLVMANLMGVKTSGAGGVAASALFMLLTSASFVSMGLIFASKMEEPHSFQVVANFVMMPMFFLSGALFPIDKLPAWLKYLVYVNPLTYGVDGMRSVLIGVSEFPPSLDLFVLLAFSTAMLLSGSYFFKKVK